MSIDSTPNILKAAHELPSYLTRFLVQDIIHWTAEDLAKKTPTLSRQSVNGGQYMCHVYVRNDYLVGVCFCDEFYPHQVAHTLVTKALDDFAAQVPRQQWEAGKEVDGFVGLLENLLSSTKLLSQMNHLPTFNLSKESCLLLVVY